VYRVLVGKPEGKGPFGRCVQRWEGNIKMEMHTIRSVFLCTCAKLQKATVTFVMSMYPSVCIEQFHSHQTDFDGI
jgi:hypothetical protein